MKPLLKQTLYRDRIAKQQGFTMVELMIVMGVSLFGLAGLMGVYTTNSSANRGSGFSAEAINVCEQTMEELRVQRIPRIEQLYAPIGTTLWGPVDHIGGNVQGRNVIFSRKISAQEIPGVDTLVRLKVDVEWLDTGRDPSAAPVADRHSVSLEMIRTRVVP